MSQEAVQKVIPFTESDLEANRRFEVTENQLNFLRNEINVIYTGSILGIVITLTILFVIAVIIDSTTGFSAIKPQNLKKPDAPNLLLGFGAVTIILFFVSVFVFLWSLVQFRNYGSRNHIVQVTEGKVERWCDEGSHVVKVGEVEFYIDESKHDAFTDQYYRVYYLNSNDILSVESLKSEI